MKFMFRKVLIDGLIGTKMSGDRNSECQVISSYK